MTKDKRNTTRTAINVNGNVDNESVIIVGDNNTIINKISAEYSHLLTGINKVFHSDFIQLSKTSLQSEDVPIVISDWSYIFLGSPAYFGYLIVTSRRFIVVSFSKNLEDKEIIESGIYTSRFINSNFEFLSDTEVKTRHVTEIPLSYINSLQQVECSIDDERMFQKTIFRLVLGTPEENDMAFGTRFFLYSREKVEKIQKTIRHYNPSAKYSYEKHLNK
jgi:hypothetical protein